MTKLPHVTWLRTFEVSARHSSFTAAAEELGLTPAAVSQQIRLLEKQLDTKLFVRLPRGVTLTDAGKAYAQPIRRSFADMQSVTSGLFRKERMPAIRVRASISFAGLVLAPRISEFHALYPDIPVQLTSFVWADRFDDDPSDIDIRYGTGDWDDGAMQHLGHETAIPVCHPDFVASFPQPLTIQALAAGPTIQIMGSEADWSQLSDLHDLKLQMTGHLFKVDSSLIALQSVIAGLGTAMVLERFAQHYLDRGILIAPFEYRLPVRLSHFIVCRGKSMLKGEVRVFCDWLTAVMREK